MLGGESTFWEAPMLAVRIALRLIHVLSGAFWFGSAIGIALLLEPAAATLGSSGTRFMAELFKPGGRTSRFMAGASMLTVLSGLGLYLMDAGLLPPTGFNPAWAWSPSGLGFLAGGSLGVCALIVGSFLIRPAAEKWATQAAQRLNAPSESKLPEAVALGEARLHHLSWIGALLVFSAIVLMAVARYLP
jgi:hypothetical protein